jgi:hypothetical protein
VYSQGKMLRYLPMQEASSVPCSISKKGRTKEIDLLPANPKLLLYLIT